MINRTNYVIQKQAKGMPELARFEDENDARKAFINDHIGTPRRLIAITVLCEID